MTTTTMMSESEKILRKFFLELGSLIYRVDNRLDEYGEPNKSPLRAELREIIDFVEKQKRNQP